MPALFAPALDLAALSAVMVLMGLLIVTVYTFERLADVLDFSVLGIHPLRNVASAIRNTIVAGCNAGIAALQNVARDLWHGLTWAIGEFVDGTKSFAAHTESALRLLWGTSIPAYVSAKLQPLIRKIGTVEASIENTTLDVAHDVARLDAKIENTAVVTLQTAVRDIGSAIKASERGLNDQIDTIKTSTEHAIQHALDLARAESGKAIDTLKRVEDAAIGALREAETLTQDELGDLVRSIDRSDLYGIAATVPILATLVHTLAAESGLDNAACRGKVKDICRSDPSDWAWLLGGVAAAGFGFGLAEIVEAGREVIHYIDAGAEDFASLG